MNKINLIVYDFDGVMTDNCALVDEKGNELVKVNRSDGLAISKIKEKIKKIASETLKTKGGEGVIREFYDFILQK